MRQMIRLRNLQRRRAAHINGSSGFSKGQMLVLFTMILPVLLGVMALGADFAIIYLNWAMVQKAADAAALAGASQLTAVPGSAPSVTPAATNYVNGYACLNGISDPSKTYATICPSEASHPGGFADQIVFTNVTDTQVSVGIKRTVPYYFGKMIGLQQAAVAAKATAAIEPPGTVPTGLFPIGLPCKSPCNNLNDLLSGLSQLNSSGSGNVTLGSKFIVTDLWNQLAPGNYGWIDVGQGSGAKALGGALQNGSTNSYTLNQSLGTSTGVGKGNSNPAQSGLSARLNSCAKGYDPCANGGVVPSSLCSDNCVINLPVVDYTGCSGTSCSMPIEGFAQVYLEQDSTTSAIDVCVVTSNNCTGAEGSSNAPNYGSLAPPVLIN
jgi:Flp pilus assembly protein TadG